MDRAQSGRNQGEHDPGREVSGALGVAAQDHRRVEDVTFSTPEAHVGHVTVFGVGRDVVHASDDTR